MYIRLRSYELRLASRTRSFALDLLPSSRAFTIQKQKATPRDGLHFLACQPKLQRRLVHRPGLAEPPPTATLASASRSNLRHIGIGVFWMWCAIA